jgi:hypothetical protein
MIMSVVNRDFRRGLPAKTSTRPCFSFLIGLMLLLLPVTAGAASGDDSIDRVLAAVAESNINGTAGAPPAPTGDALFDRYAQAVDARIMSLPANSEEQSSAAILPDTDLAAWEPQFGQDPRFWELRYFCARVNGSQALAPGFSKPMDLLREAQQRGVASCNILLLLYDELRQEHNATLDAYTGNAGPALMHEQEQQELELLNAAVAAGPDQAWAYYTRAQYWMELGSQDLVQQDLLAGNSAAQNIFPRPWPMQLLAGAPGEKSPPGGAAVCGALWIAVIRYPLPNFIRIKDHLREAFVCENLGGAGGYLESWHQFACRYGASSPERLIQSLVGQVLEGMISTYAEESGFGERESQLDALLRCRGAREAMLNIVRSRQGIEPDLFKLNAIFTSMGYKRGYYAIMYANLCYEIHTTAALQPFFTDRSQIHYPQLELPLAMLKYEALTKEQATQRSQERHKQLEAEQNN